MSSRLMDFLSVCTISIPNLRYQYRWNGNYILYTVRMKNEPILMAGYMFGEWAYHSFQGSGETIDNFDKFKNKLLDILSK